MSFVTNHRVDDRIVNNFYEKQSTEGAASNFTSEAPGQRVLIRRADAVEDAQTGSLTFTLPFSFLLKQNQLEVLHLPTAGEGFVRLLDEDTYNANGDLDANTDVYYQEIDSTTVTIFNPASLTGDLFLFSVPFTSLPADLRERLTVKNQGDNIALEMLGAGDGILMTSRQGKRFLIQIDEGGNLSRKEL